MFSKQFCVESSAQQSERRFNLWDIDAEGLRSLSKAPPFARIAFPRVFFRMSEAVKSNDKNPEIVPHHAAEPDVSLGALAKLSAPIFIANRA